MANDEVELDLQNAGYHGSAGQQKLKRCRCEIPKKDKILEFAKMEYLMALSLGNCRRNSIGQCVRAIAKYRW